MADQGKRILDKAYDGLEDEVPDRLARAIRWMRDSSKRWVRLSVGVLLVIASFGWFLPILGLEMLPIGLLLMAQDLPFLRKPVGRFMLRLETDWITLRRRWRRWRLRSR